MRRNLSGVYLFDKFEEEKEEKDHPTCFEDCHLEVQKKFLNSLDEEGLKSLVIMLADTLHQIGNKFDIVSG